MEVTRRKVVVFFGYFKVLEGRSWARVINLVCARRVGRTYHLPREKEGKAMQQFSQYCFACEKYEFAR